MDREFLQRKVSAWLESLDHDGDGVITQTDIDTVDDRALKAFGLVATSTQGKALKAASEKFWKDVAGAADTDRDGRINREEFSQAADSFTPAVQPWIEALVVAADSDGDGQLTGEEYKALMVALGTNVDGGSISTGLSPLSVEEAQRSALEAFADNQPYSPATWTFGKF
ncbi:EF-hand domain-containing protein [Nonomuraea insulae]|uniref:EF-hand domain-containing protein n=1 Tax=Nonomuraea insulae TaxID=1616787 RepID=A0ABW1CP53_9ACTN